jgi:hypothetical protein
MVVSEGNNFSMSKQKIYDNALARLIVGNPKKNERSSSMKRILSLSTLHMSIEILLVIVLLMAALPNVITTKASAQQEPEAPTAIYWYQCNGPTHVGLFTDRVHIYCTTTTPISGAPALNGILWFAFPTGPDSAEASRFMSIMQSSHITGETVWVEVDPNDTSGTTFGCGATNCRRIYGIELR